MMDIINQMEFYPSCRKLCLKSSLFKGGALDASYPRRTDAYAQMRQYFGELGDRQPGR